MCAHEIQSSFKRYTCTLHELLIRQNAEIGQTSDQETKQQATVLGLSLHIEFCLGALRRRTLAYSHKVDVAN